MAASDVRGGGAGLSGAGGVAGPRWWVSRAGKEVGLAESRRTDPQIGLPIYFPFQFFGFYFLLFLSLYLEFKVKSNLNTKLNAQSEKIST